MEMILFTTGFAVTLAAVCNYVRYRRLTQMGLQAPKIIRIRKCNSSLVRIFLLFSVAFRRYSMFFITTNIFNMILFYFIRYLRVRIQFFVYLRYIYIFLLGIL